MRDGHWFSNFPYIIFVQTCGKRGDLSKFVPGVSEIAHIDSLRFSSWIKDPVFEGLLLLSVHVNARFGKITHF